MAESRRKSLLFYKYLCHKIGTQVDVRTRRLSFIICDIHNHPYKRSTLKLFPQISSGSKAEGLDLSGSDVDIMLIDNRFEVYESEREVVQGRMDTKDTPHFFSKLRLLTDYNRAYDISRRFKRFLHFEGSKCLLSSELYKEHNLNMIRQDAPKFDTRMVLVYQILMKDYTTKSLNSVVKFNAITKNIGSGYNSNTGVFTVSLNGTYEFAVNFIKGNETEWLELQQMKNNRTIVSGHAAYDTYSSGSFQAILELEEGDIIYVPQQRISGNIYGHNFIMFSCHFIGLKHVNFHQI